MEKLIDEVRKKKEFSEIPVEDIERALNRFAKLEDEVRVKRARDLLRRIYSGFGGRKLLVYKDKSAEEILKKHLSTRERYEHYEDIYLRLLKGLKKEISIIDLGAGVNGFSYGIFGKLGFKVKYLGVEGVGQLVELMNKFFTKEKFDAKAFHLSIFEIDKVIGLIKKVDSPKVIFMFKVVDSLEKLERDFTLRFLQELKKAEFERIVVSFATRSWYSRRKFFVKRNWLVDFIHENFKIIDDFEISGERYIVFRKI